jgi:hypothetical protein
MASGRFSASQRAADPSASQLLATAGRYVAAYESSFGAVVAQERYRQSTNGPANSRTSVSRRESTGDILLFNSGAESGGAGWMAFREFQTMDNKPLPSQPGRLAALAANPTRDALAEVMRVNALSGGYTIGDVATSATTIGNLPRAPAIPTAALVYLRSARQTFSTFELDGMKTTGDAHVAALKFTEHPRARMADADDFTIAGRFLIEPDTGRVVHSELTVTSTIFKAKIEVDYASAGGTVLWMPVRLFEQYTWSLPARMVGSRTSGVAPPAYVDGLATYQGFQRFELKPGLSIK